MSEFLELGRAVRRYKSVWRVLATASAVSIGFYLVGALAAHDGAYWYLVWNLFLAWLPLLLAVCLVTRLPRHGWSSWPSIALTLLWLVFLPNSFYIVSDFVHLSVQSNNVLFTAVMLLSFALNGLALGFLSLWLVHRELLTRFRARTAHELVGVILLLTSFAIYLGRNLRWNTWDVLTNPAGVLFDISDPFLNPRTHLVAFTTTLTFLALLGSIYWIVWQLAQLSFQE